MCRCPCHVWYPCLHPCFIGVDMSVLCPVSLFVLVFTHLLVNCLWPLYYVAKTLLIEGVSAQWHTPTHAIMDYIRLIYVHKLLLLDKHQIAHMCPHVRVMSGVPDCVSVYSFINSLRSLCYVAHTLLIQEVSAQWHDINTCDFWLYSINLFS